MNIYKTATTIKEYQTTYGTFKTPVVVPVGSVVSNRTACGYDDNYRFWQDFYKSGLGEIMNHDLKHYGLNIPAEYCEPYNA